MFFEIKPYIGVGPIEFGMTIDLVRKVIGGEVKSFMKTEESETYTDAFIGKGIHVNYNRLGNCEAVEFGRPAEPLFMGNKLIGVPFKKIKKLFEAFDSSLDIDDTGFTSFELGAGIYVPTLKKSLMEPVEGIIVFEKGYYD